MPEGGVVRIGTKGWARPYQADVARYFIQENGRHAFEVWHRKAGKDRIATWIESALAMRRPGLYWHALPKYEDARRVVWDAITPDGQRLIDINFPREICKRRLDHDMKIELVNGSIWQPVGADNFNSLVGASPVHVTYSEYAIMHPKARQFIQPALVQNNGTELIITTPRGYNHAWDLYDYAKHSPLWHASIQTVNDTGVLSAEMLEEERNTMPEELYRQEYLCDFSSANVGAILGRYVEQAEKEGRITDDLEYDPEGAPVEISCDIGFRDTAAFWFWQPRFDGFALLDYDEDNGLDAQEWIPRIEALAKDRGYKIGKIHLPHDAKAKTFQWRHSVHEQFSGHFTFERIGVVPQAAKHDRINAARTLFPLCYFHRTRCAEGLAALRSWSFAFDDERRVYSREPLHDWASNGADGFSYGAQVMRERKRPEQKKRGIPGPKPWTGDWLMQGKYDFVTPAQVSRYKVE